jgi:DinB family protein
MRAELEAIVADFNLATDRLRALAHRVPESRWSERVDPSRWSIAECVGHLNLTSDAYLPLMQTGLAQARQQTIGSLGHRYRRDFIGWVLWRTAGPPVRLRVKTTAPLVPTPASPPDLVAAFERLQEAQLSCLREAEGLPIDRVTITSPFNARLKYNLYAAMTILPRHQHRHLWQAEQVWDVLRARSKS